MAEEAQAEAILGEISDHLPLPNGKIGVDLD